MDRNNVVFTTFVYAEAVLIKSLLEANGVTVFLFDENTARLNPIYSSDIGGIKLMVPHEQVGKAREVLLEYRETEGQKADGGSFRSNDHESRDGGQPEDDD